MVDPFSITTGALQVVTCSASCIVTIAQWAQKVKTVDKRIQDFMNEIEALRVTHDALHTSLKSPGMQAAAQMAEQNSGNELWERISKSLSDCRSTMKKLEKILKDIDTTRRNPLRKPIKQFQESLVSGDIATLRERIRFFNSVMQLPATMLTVTQQIEQKEVAADHFHQLDAKISLQMKMTNRVLAALNSHIAERGPEAATAISDEETMVYEGLESCLETAQKFWSNASAVSSVKSGSTIMPTAPQETYMDFGRAASISGHPLTYENRSKIECWVPEAPIEENFDDEHIPPSRDSTEILSQATDLRSRLRRGSVIGDGDDGDVDYELTRKYLQMGQTKFDNEEYAGAETSFRKAMKKLEKHDLKDRIALELGEVHLMLASACLKQNKFDEAEKLLLPLTEETEDSDPLRIASANHTLGELYLRKGEHDSAEAHGQTAYRSRRTHMGKTHSLCIQSVELLVQVYKAKNDVEEVEAWQEMMPATPSLDPLARNPTILREDNISPLSDLNKEAELGSTGAPSIRQKKPRNPFRRQSSGSVPTLQRSKSKELVSPEIRASKTSSIQSYQTTSTGLSPVLLPKSSVDEPLTRIDTSFSLFKKSKPRSPSKDKERSMPKSTTGPRRIFADSKRVTAKQAASVGFSTVKELCAQGNHKQAAREAISFLQAYTNGTSVPFEEEIEKNIEKGGNLGLAATGQGYAPIHFFVSLQAEHAFEIGLLIENGVDVNATASLPGSNLRLSPGTPLQLAVERGHKKIVEKLLKTPAINLEVTDSSGKTPVFVGFDQNDTKMVELLLKRGAASRYRQPNGEIKGLLGTAVKFSAPNVAKMVLDRDGLEIAAANQSCLIIDAVRTRDLPEQVARRKRENRVEMVRMLLQAGVNPKEKDEEGRRATDYAMLENCPDVVRVLEQHRTPKTLVEWPGLA